MAMNVDISKITGINQVGNSYQRKSAVPLDYYSFFNTKAAAETYAASNPVAYIGQYVAYTHEGKVFACVIADEAGTLKEIGSKPIGDNASIEVAEDGKVSLYGFNELTNDKVRYLPVTKLVGEGTEAHLEIEWVSELSQLADETKLAQAASVTAVGDDTSYAIEAVRADKDGNLAVVLPKQPVVDLIKAEVGSVGHLKREIVTKLPAIKDADADTIYMVKGGTPASAIYTTEVRMDSQWELINGTYEQVAPGDQGLGSAIIHSGDEEEPHRLAPGVYYASIVSPNELDFKYALKEVIRVDIDLGNGDIIPLDENGFFTLESDLPIAADVLLFNTEGESQGAPELTLYRLNESTNVYKEYMLVNGVFEQIGDTAVNLDGYATEDYVDDKLEAYAYSKLEVDNLIGTPGVPEVTDEDGKVITEAKPGTGVYQHVYSKSEVADLIADITGGESAAIKAELKEYKTTNDTRVLAIEKEVWGTDAEGKVNSVTGTSRIDAHADRILALESKVGHDVKGDDSPATGLFAEIDAVSERAEKGISDAYDAAQAVVALEEGQVAANKKKVDDLAILVGTNADYTPDGDPKNTLAYRIGALEAHDVAHAIEFSTLSGTVGQNTEDIATNKGAINKINTVDIPALQAAIKAEEKARKDAIGAPSTPGVGQEGDENYVAPTAATGVYAAIEAVADTIDFTPYLTKVEAGNTYATITALNGVKSDLAILVGNDKTADGKPTMSVRDIVKAEVGSAGHLKREIVEALPNIADADPDTIYMIKTGGPNAVMRIIQDGYCDVIDGQLAPNADKRFYEVQVTPGATYKVSTGVTDATATYYIKNEVGTYIVAGVLDTSDEAVPGDGYTYYQDSLTIPADAAAVNGIATCVIVVNDKININDIIPVQAGGDQYKEYMLIDGVFEQIGDTTVNLTGYATEDFVRQLVTNSAPGRADTNTLGLVKSTAAGENAAPNKVTVEEDGTMTVTKISTDILVNSSTEELILFGGTASTAVKQA